MNFQFTKTFDKAVFYFTLNIFINDISDNYDRYGVNISRKRCYDSLFANDVVLLVPSKPCLRILLK